MSPVRVVLYFVVEIVAGIAASAVVLGLTPGGLHVTTYVSGLIASLSLLHSCGHELSPRSRLADGVSYAQGVLIEMLATAALCLCVAPPRVELTGSTVCASSSER